MACLQGGKKGSDKWGRREPLGCDKVEEFLADGVAV